METPDKSLVQKRFSRGLPTYSDAASVQRHMAERLTQMICGRRTDFGSVLEIGAGTGLLTGLLDRSIRWDHRIVNDLVEGCGPFHADRTNTVFVPGDAEKLDLDAGSFGLICSNAVFQWLADLPSFLKKMHRASAPDGLLAFSTFGPDNLKELAELTGRGLDYHPRAVLENLLAGAGYRVLDASEEIRVQSFDGPREILAQMRRTGVNASGARTWWTPRRMAGFCAEYERRFRLPSGQVRLTWRPVYLLAVKN